MFDVLCEFITCGVYLKKIFFMFVGYHKVIHIMLLLSQHAQNVAKIVSEKWE